MLLWKIILVVTLHTMIKVLEVIDNDELKFGVKGCVKEVQMAS